MKYEQPTRPAHEVVVHSIDPVAARAMGIVGRGALLVRPDRTPVASWSTSTDATARLRDATTPLAVEDVDRSAAWRAP